ncbi:MAG: RecX family transcriptional regulator [Bacteroidales bacterium]|nr:RecX family transcriptional regulator [Bacteroidales bacterium]
MEHSEGHTPTPRLLDRARRYCAAQEQCEHAVRQKLAAWGAEPGEAGLVVESLREEGYLDDVRYARAFCESKMLRGGWGRRRVEAALRAKRLSAEAIAEGLSAVDDDRYFETLTAEAAKKLRLLGGGSDAATRQRLSAFLASRGYTMEEIHQVITNNLQQ